MGRLLGQSTFKGQRQPASSTFPAPLFLCLRTYCESNGFVTPLEVLIMPTLYQVGRHTKVSAQKHIENPFLIMLLCTSDRLNWYVQSI
jgi:hypothetical protein